MASCGCSTSIHQYGSDPINIQWTVVRGSTASLRIDFLENDETTHWDIDGWIFKSTAYDPLGDVLDDIDVEAFDGYIVLDATSCLTNHWGTSYADVVAELRFDVRATIPGIGTDVNDTFWTPVIGTIRVLGNVTPGGSL